MKLKNLMGRWIRGGALAGTSFTVLLGAGTAHALDPVPLCPLPSLETCTQPGYLTTTCGQQHASRCHTLIGDAYQQEWNALTAQHVEELPDSLGGGLATSRIAPNTELGSSFVESNAGTYSGSLLKTQVLHRKNFQNLTESDVAQQNELQAMEANGTTLRSCKEFVREKYYDYSLFNERMGRHGADYRAIFEDAYAANGIAYKDLKGKAGGILAPIFSSQATAPKNLYFRAQQQYPYPTGMTGYPINPALLQQVPAQGLTYYTPSFAWHEQMSDSLSGQHDTRLNRLFGKQLKFSALINRRNAAWATYNRRAQGLSGTPLTELRQKTTTELQAMDQAIEDGLEEAQALGCLGLSGNLCDWSPRRFKEMLDAEMLRRQETDYASCQAITGNDFSATAFVRNADVLQIAALTGDYATSPARLSTYINQYRQALLQEARVVVPYTSETKRSDSRSSSDSFGNTYFGASYRYGAGWNFNTTSQLGACQSFDADLYGYFEANARIYTTSREILYASAEATATPEQLGYDVLVRVLGVDVYSPSGSFPTSFSVTPSKSVRQEFFSAKFYITVLYIPISVTAGISGTVGLDTALSGQFNSGCRFTLRGELEPFARLDAFGAVAIDVGFASAGVRGDLSIIEAELPFSASISVYLDTTSSPYRLMADLDSDLQLNVSTLSGRFVVFAQAFGLYGEKELASFSGVTHSTPLMSEHRTVPLSSFY